MRTILRRVLLASWMIPFIWLILYPIGWLMEGRKVKYALVILSKEIWNGIDE